jgi:hypothetical protein
MEFLAALGFDALVAAERSKREHGGSSKSLSIGGTEFELSDGGMVRGALPKGTTRKAFKVLLSDVWRRL